MAENEQSGFHEGVTIPVKPVGAGTSIHTDVTVVMPKTVGVEGSLLQTAVQAVTRPVVGVSADANVCYSLVRAIGGRGRARGGARARGIWRRMGSWSGRWR
jgi:hypothetical protein